MRERSGMHAPAWHLARTYKERGHTTKVERLLIEEPIAKLQVDAQRLVPDAELAQAGERDLECPQRHLAVRLEA
jgi:hypothetical protein